MQWVHVENETGNDILPSTQGGQIELSQEKQNIFVYTWWLVLINEMFASLRVIET